VTCLLCVVPGLPILHAYGYDQPRAACGGGDPKPAVDRSSLQAATPGVRPGVIAPEHGRRAREPELVAEVASRASGPLDQPAVVKERTVRREGVDVLSVFEPLHGVREELLHGHLV